jgi:hypothetical protein
MTLDVISLDVISFHVRSKVRSSLVVKVKSSAYVRIVLGEEVDCATFRPLLKITQLNNTSELHLTPTNVMALGAILQRYGKFVSRYQGTP